MQLLKSLTLVGPSGAVIIGACLFVLFLSIGLNLFIRSRYGSMARDIEEISVKPPRAGRFTLAVKFRAGLDRQTRGYWVEPEHEAALRAFVSDVAAAAA